MLDEAWSLTASASGRGPWEQLTLAGTRAHLVRLDERRDDRYTVAARELTAALRSIRGELGFNNPTTFADPAGTMSNYTYGLEKENAALKATNKTLRDIIKQQDAAIAEQQDIINEQQREINELYTYISSLEAIIREQQAYIAQLEAQVRDLQRQVAYWRSEAHRWQRKALYWQGRAMYYAGIVDQLGGRLWGEGYITLGIAASIHSGRGIPEGAFAFDRISALEAQNANLMADIRAVTNGGMVRQETWDWIHENRAAGATEAQITGYIGLGMYSAYEMESNEMSRYGRERYDAGYNSGYEAGQNSSGGGWSCAVSVAGTGATVVGLVASGPPTGGASWVAAGAGVASAGLGGVSIYQSC